MSYRLIAMSVVSNLIINIVELIIHIALVINTIMDVSAVAFISKI